MLDSTISSLRGDFNGEYFFSCPHGTHRPALRDLHWVSEPLRLIEVPGIWTAAPANVHLPESGAALAADQCAVNGCSNDRIEEKHSGQRSVHKHGKTYRFLDTNLLPPED